MIDITTFHDCYPFGSVMPNQNNLGAGTYRYGMNGMERDNEIKGSGNSYTSDFRQYDPRLGRWMSDEPKPVAWESGYAAFRNNPIYFADPLGDFPNGVGDGVKKAVTGGSKFVGSFGGTFAEFSVVAAKTGGGIGKAISAIGKVGLATTMIASIDNTRVPGVEFFDDPNSSPSSK